MSNDRGWYGVDLDGTLAHYTGWQGIHHIGDPVPRMLGRVKSWLAGGRTVKIFTARVSVREEPELSVVKDVIWDWCLKHGLPKLEITCIKDFSCLLIFDDRCRQVEENTGRIIGEPLQSELRSA